MERWSYSIAMSYVMLGAPGKLCPPKQAPWAPWTVKAPAAPEWCLLEYGGREREREYRDERLGNALRQPSIETSVLATGVFSVAT